MKCTAKSDTGAKMETQRLFNTIPSLLVEKSIVRATLLAACAVICTFAGSASHGQTLNVLHAFSGSDGANPFAG